MRRSAWNFIGAFNYWLRRNGPSCKTHALAPDLSCSVVVRDSPITPAIINFYDLYLLVSLGDEFAR